jgi:hypothetical protein
MNFFSRVKKPFVFAALVLTLVLSSAFIPLNAGGSSARSSCAGTYSKEIRYYSNAAHTQQVGTGMIYCNGTGTLTGTSTAYREEDILDICCDDPGGNSCVPC